MSIHELAQQLMEALNGKADKTDAEYDLAGALTTYFIQSRGESN